jgi:hypothetical protein
MPHRNRMMAALAGPIGSAVIAVTGRDLNGPSPLFSFRGLVQLAEHASRLA